LTGAVTTGESGVVAEPLATTASTTRAAAGRGAAMTVLTTLTWRGSAVVGVLLRAQAGPRSTRFLRFPDVHFASWSLVRRLPANRDHPGVILRYSHLLYESAYDGGWEEHADALFRLRARGVSAFWSLTYGFPGMKPNAPLKRWLRAHELEAGHGYSAYPEATRATVLAALELEDRLRPLIAGAGDRDPKAFDAHWRATLTAVQRCL
jgi:hypothetical protein